MRARRLGRLNSWRRCRCVRDSGYGCLGSCGCGRGLYWTGGLAQQEVERLSSQTTCLPGHLDGHIRIEVCDGDAKHIRGAILEVLGLWLELDTREPWTTGRVCPNDVVISKAVAVGTAIGRCNACEAIRTDGDIADVLFGLVGDAIGNGGLAR